MPVIAWDVRRRILGQEWSNHIMSITNIVSAIPDHVRLIPVVFQALRMLALAIGYTFFEDGSMAP